MYTVTSYMIAAITEAVLGVSMTQSPLLHSHLEVQRVVPVDQLKKHVRLLAESLCSLLK